MKKARSISIPVRVGLMRQLLSDPEYAIASHHEARVPVEFVYHKDYEELFEEHKRLARQYEELNVSNNTLKKSLSTQAWQLKEEQEKKVALKTVAIMGGGDWYDASVSFLDIPKGIDLKSEQQKYSEWYTKIYCPDLHAGGRPKYFAFTDWLIKYCGAKPSVVVEEFWS